MLTFLAPSGLLALLGVAVPIAIHLWNRRPARTVQVGSIRWLAVAANRRLRNLKLEQLALLLLRLLLLGTLALAVAGPVWRQPPPPRRGQVLISPDVLASESLPAVKPAVDSLKKRGYVLRQLRQGFSRVSDTTWQQLGTSGLEMPAMPADANFWSLVAQAADSFPAQPIQVYSSAALRHFRGIRPALPANVRWQTVPLPAPETRWLSSASLTSPDSLRLSVSRSTDEGVYTSSQTVVRPRQLPALLPRVTGLPPLRYQLTATGKTIIQVLAADSLQVPVLTHPLRVWLYHDADHSLDARYLQAALRAAALGLAPRLVLTVSTRLPAVTDSLNWLCWLANAPVPASWQQRIPTGLHLWQDGKKPGRVVETSFEAAPYQQQYQVTRLTPTPAAPAFQVLWQAANGQPVLTRHPSGRGAAYQFHSRLHPAWSTLADGPHLPLLLLSLLQPDALPALADAHDQRQLDPAQVVGANARLAPRRPVAVQPTDTDLRVWVLVAAGLLWAAERLVAARVSSSKAAAAV